VRSQHREPGLAVSSVAPVALAMLVVAALARLPRRSG
jgi:hypothetical protein